MLKAMRSGTKSPLMKFFLIFLAAGFALWGIGDGTTGLIGGSDKAISGGTVSVSPGEVAKEFERSRRRFMSDSDTDQALQNGLLNEVIGSLSRDVLIQAENEHLGLTVTRQMQTDAIRNEPVFRDKNGEFSEGMFLQSLANAGLSENDYLRRVDIALMREQLVGALASGASFHSDSAKAIAAYDLEKRRAQLINFAVNPDEINSPTVDELNSFFEDNKVTYSAPEMRSARVGVISDKMVAESIEIKDEEIKLVFENRINEFIIPETRDLRQMVFDDQEQANRAMAFLSSGKEFSVVAKDMLNWAETDTNLGTIGEGMLETSLSDAAFGAKIGVPIGPIESPFGHHIIMVDKINESADPKLSDIRQKIIDTLREEKSLDLLYERANELEDVLGTGASLREATERVGGKIAVVDNVDRNGLNVDGIPVEGDIGDLVQDSGVLDLIWNTPLNEISVIQEGADNLFFVIEVVSESVARERQLDEVRSRVIEDWKLEQAITQARKKAEKSFSKNKRAGFETKPFQRNGAGLDHQASTLIARAAFAQSIGESVVVETGSEAILVKTLEVIEPTNEDVINTSKIVVDMMNNALRDDVLNMTLIFLSEKHDLNINMNSVQKLLSRSN